MANIKTVSLKSNTLRSMLYKHATRGMTELEELAYNNLKKGLEKGESWATKLHYENKNKMWDKNIINSVDLSSIDFEKYKETKDISELCIALSQSALKNDDNRISLNDLKDIIHILTNLKVASKPENFAVDLSDEKLLKINEIINENEYAKIKVVSN